MMKKCECGKVLDFLWLTQHRGKDAPITGLCVQENCYFFTEFSEKDSDFTTITVGTVAG
jgi:hypothetical protein